MKSLTDPVHFSNLKLMAKSAQHYRAAIGLEEDESKYRIGRATHALILGVQPGVQWDVYEGRRAGKEWEKFKADRPGVDIFIPSEMALARAMAGAIAANPLANDLLKGDFEIPVEWTDETGRRCATRGIDLLHREGRAYTLDVKTAQSSQPERFTWEALRLGYHAQGAFYMNAARSLGVDVQDHFLIAVEKKAPHPVTVMRLSARVLEDGRRLIRSWMEQLKVCEESDQWPGYCQSIVELDVAEDVTLTMDDGEEIAA